MLKQVSNFSTNIVQAKRRTFSTTKVYDYCDELVPSKFSRKSLLVFDIDDSLYTPKNGQMLGSSSWFYKTNQKLIENNKFSDFKEASDYTYPLAILLQHHTPVMPVQPELPFLLKQLQDEQILMIGLTARRPSLSTRTLTQLEELDISSLGIRNVPSFSFSNDSAVYEKGVIFAGENQKGLILKEFLEFSSPFLTNLSTSFDEIYFYDDHESHVTKMEHVVKSMGLNYYGRHYTRMNCLYDQYDEMKALNELKLLFNRLASLPEPDPYFEKLLQTRDPFTIEMYESLFGRSFSHIKR